MVSISHYSIGNYFFNREKNELQRQHRWNLNSQWVKYHGSRINMLTRCFAQLHRRLLYWLSVWVEPLFVNFSHVYNWIILLYLGVFKLIRTTSKPLRSWSPHYWQPCIDPGELHPTSLTLECYLYYLWWFSSEYLFEQCHTYLPLDLTTDRNHQSFREDNHLNI